ncbi:tyrosine-type recombinase/integrase [Microbacterium sp. CH-015]|uniref:tyrosine-type recombinase/integrase n=1 Tax=Microbacterium sp. CH-015 TaxID=3406734 RepID=UPI003C715728
MDRYQVVTLQAAVYVVDNDEMQASRFAGDWNAHASCELLNSGAMPRADLDWIDLEPESADATEPEGYLFPGRDNGHLSPRYVGKIIRDLLPGEWTMHTLRHRFGTRAYALTSDLLLVQDLLGHSSPSTTRRYVAGNPQRAPAAIEALAEQDEQLPRQRPTLSAVS